MIRALVLLALLVAAPAHAEPRANDLMLAGRLQEALPAAKAEAEEAPGDVAAQERYIDLLLTLGMPSAAIGVCRDRVATHPTDPTAHYLLGRAVTKAHDAQASYERALRLDPDHARSHMGMGAIHRANGLHLEAESAYRRATTLDPQLVEAWTGLTYALLAQDRGPEALAVARQTVAKVPDAADGYLALAVLAPTEAVGLLTTAAARAPNDPRVHVALAEVHLGAGRGKAASDAARRALAIDPNRGDAMLAAMFADALVAGTLDAEGWRSLVAARSFEDTDLDEAGARYEALVRSYPSSALPLLARARVRVRLADLAGAEADLRRAMALDATNIEARAALGIVLLESGKAAEARPLLEAAARERSRDASLAIAAGRAAAEAGDAATALVRMAAAERTWPYDARVALAHAKVRSDSGDAEGAYRVLRGALERISDGRLVLALAAAARDTGRYDEAATILEQVGRQTGNAELLDLARRLRETPPG